MEHRGRRTLVRVRRKLARKAGGLSGPPVRDIDTGSPAGGLAAGKVMTTGRNPTIITRRRFIAGFAAIPAFGCTWPGEGGDDLARFRSLSARLTGFPEEALDRDLALGLMEGLASTGDGPGVERLLSGTARDADADLLRRIVVAWYSGIHPAVGGPTVRAAHDALVWRALDFTNPPGRCSVEPGDWADPPVGTVVR